MLEASAGAAVEASTPPEFSPPHVTVHTPLLQPSACGQATPHPPQLFRSLAVSVHVAVAFEPTLPQRVVPVGHDAAHAPFAQTSDVGQIGPQTPDEQSCPVPHVVPHPPQLVGSLVMSTQPLLHPIHVPPPYSLQLEQLRPPSAEGADAQPSDALVPPHDGTQWPPAQVWPLWHWVLHWPQLLGSVWRLAQRPVTVSLPPPHSVVPLGHDVPQKPPAHTPPPVQIGAHCPLTQLWPVAHWVPHVPQLSKSLVTSVQPSLHAIQVPPYALQLEQLGAPPSGDGELAQPLDAFPPPQLGSQLPWEQACPPGHALAQVPQLLLSLVRSTHVVGSLGHVVVPPGHVVPQKPPLQTAQLDAIPASWPPVVPLSAVDDPASVPGLVVASYEADASCPCVPPVEASCVPPVEASCVPPVEASCVPPVEASAGSGAVVPASSAGAIMSEPTVAPSATKPSLKCVT
jgi:hypothetical protein